MATTTNYGFEIPDDTDLVKDGALAMRDLGQDVDTQLFQALGGNYPGLRLVKKQTIGTSVSSVTVNDAFSATYDAYKIIVAGGTASASDYMRLQLGASTASYDESLLVKPYTSAFIAASNTNQPSFSYAGNTYASQATFLNVELVNPFLAKFTTLTSMSAGQTVTAFGTYGGIHKVATSYTAFTLIPVGTLTGGTIYVYGYGAS
jgi:hypothetical protein